LTIKELEEKIIKLDLEQIRMKAVNSYFQEHKTLDGCKLITDQEKELLNEKMILNFRTKKNPYDSDILLRNNQNVRNARLEIKYRLKNGLE